MKRSHAFHEKIRLNLSKKLRLPPEQCTSERGSGEIRKALPSSSKDPQIQENLNLVTSDKSSSLTSADLFRTKLTEKLKTTLDCLVSQLQNQSDQSGAEAVQDRTSSAEDSLRSNEENDAAELVLQNFIHSAKSQISGLLSKGKQVHGNTRKGSVKPFNVDPLQIQISLKLQDLLCNALDNQRCNENNAADNSGLINEIELRNLSHLLQDFLGSAKKKLSFSLNPEQRSNTEVLKNKLSQIPGKAPELEKVHLFKENTSSKNFVEQQVQELNGSKQEENKRQLRKRRGAQLVNTSLQLVVNTEIINATVTNEVNLAIKSHKVVKKASKKVGESDSSLNCRNLRKRPYKSCQNKISDNKKSKNTVQVDKNSKSIEANETIKPDCYKKSDQNISLKSNKSLNFKSVSQNISGQNSNSIESKESLTIQSKSDCQNKSSQNTKSIESKNSLNFKSQSKSQNISGQISDSIESLKIQTRSENQNKSNQTSELHKSNSKLNGNPKNSSKQTMETSQYSNPNYMNSGILLLSECERTPDFLDLNLEVQDSDVDDPDQEVFNRADFIRSTYQDSDSDEDVVVLGEKKPTYQEITLDEDDDGEVCEKVVEVAKPIRIPKSFQDLLYDCPNCDKKFRVESLLKFHVRMHSVVESKLGRMANDPQPEIIEEVDASQKAKKLKASQSKHKRKEKENNKQNSKTSRKPKLQKEKHAKKKSKTTS